MLPQVFIYILLETVHSKLNICTAFTMHSLQSCSGMMEIYTATESNFFHFDFLNSLPVVVPLQSFPQTLNSLAEQ